MLFAVNHSHYIEEYNLYNTKNIGIFSSKELAERIIAYKSRNEQWFKKYPNWFEITKFFINDDKNFIFELWKTKLYALYYYNEEEERWKTLGIYSSKSIAKEKKNELIEKMHYKKKELYVDEELLDCDHWREGFISAGEAMDSIPKD